MWRKQHVHAYFRLKQGISVYIISVTTVRWEKTDGRRRRQVLLLTRKNSVRKDRRKQTEDADNCPHGKHHKGKTQTTNCLLPFAWPGVLDTGHVESWQHAFTVRVWSLSGTRHSFDPQCMRTTHNDNKAMGNFVKKALASDLEILWERSTYKARLKASFAHVYAL